MTGKKRRKKKPRKEKVTDSVQKSVKALKKLEEKKEETKRKKAWWDKEPDLQEYDDAFFKPYIKNLEPKIPSDYSDPILEEENRILSSDEGGWKNPGPNNPNIPALWKFYEKKVMPKLVSKKTLVSILIPSGDGNMVLNCGVGLSTMYKPHHRIHTIMGHNIDILRNSLVKMALKVEDCTHVFFLDSDVIMPPFGLMRMVRRDLDIVSGIYVMRAPPYVPLAIMRPRNVKTGEKMFNYYFEITEQLLGKCVPCDATGAGCLLIKREVLENMGPPWFQVTPKDHGMSAVGEDLFFFDKAVDMGYQPYLDLSVQCGHGVGSLSYPDVFFQQHLVRGPRSLQTVNIWNKNAILHSMNLKLYKIPKPPETASTSPVVTQKAELVQIEKAEAVGDAREVNR